MKFFVVLIGLLFSNIITTNIDEVRNSYRYAKQSKENTESFFELTQKTDRQNDPVLSAYYGCALTLKAAFSDKTMDKISYFRKGKKLIDLAIESNPKNIELRMIRLSVQISAPRITRYNRDIDTDKDFMIKNVDNISSPKLKEFVKGFMSNSGVFSE